MKTAEAYVAEALAYLRAGGIQLAKESLSQALALNARQADALHLLGIITFQSGDPAAARDLIEAALQARPGFADAHSNLGSVLIALGRHAEAEVALQRAVDLNPSQAVYRFNLANVLASQRKTSEAARQYERAVDLQPQHAEAWNNLGIVYRGLDLLDKATVCFEKAAALKADYAEARYNLANAYRDQNRLSAAEAEIRKAIAVQPTYAKAYNVLGNILSDGMRSAEALPAFQKASALEPRSLALGSNVLSCLQYVPGVTDAELASAHAHWVGAHNDIFATPLHRVADRSEERRLTVGFVSPDLGHHPCGFLSVGLFEHLNRNVINPIVFSTRSGAREDNLSRRIQAVTHWQRVQGMSDGELAAVIADAKVDILIDLSGHTSGHRLAAFALKPAPLQMTWLGYVGSTGLPTMDYIIADRWHAPDGIIIAGPEKILRLDNGYTSYEPPDSAPEVSPLPATRNGYITFGSLNNPAKLNAALIQSYAAVMTSVANSRIILAFRGLDDAEVSRRLRAWFGTYGISPDRVDVRGGAAPHAFLQNYNDIDIALDSAPYSGGLTTCEALWMGVPVVTFPGQTFAGRHATSYMSNAGLSDFVAPSKVEFEQRAIEKAHDTRSLQRLRATLRERLNASPVRDHKAFASSFERAMRGAWRTYVRP